MININSFLFLSSLKNISYANYLDNWRNEDLCRWMEVALIPQHISDEMYVRKGVCVNDSEVIELTTQATYASKYVAVVPSSKPSRK